MFHKVLRTKPIRPYQSNNSHNKVYSIATVILGFKYTQSGLMTNQHYSFTIYAHFQYSTSNQNSSDQLCKYYSSQNWNVKLFNWIRTSHRLRISVGIGFLHIYPVRGRESIMKDNTPNSSSSSSSLCAYRFQALLLYLSLWVYVSTSSGTFDLFQANKFARFVLCSLMIYW